MKGIGLVQQIYELDSDLSVNFFFKRSQVVTLTQDEYDESFALPLQEAEEIHGIEIPKQKERESEHGYLLIASTFDLEAYDSLTEGSAKIRPDLLVIHGILSFISKQMFWSAQSFSQRFDMVEEHIAIPNIPFVFTLEKEDYGTHLVQILTKIRQAPPEGQVLIYTLLERWRKALYLERESEDSYIHTDESILAYIHVLEVLADEFKVDLNEQIRLKRRELTKELLERRFAADAAGIKSAERLINIIHQEQVTLKAKVIQMLKGLHLYDSKLEAIVSRFIAHRNAIAHGRKDLYQDKLVYPLKPFFSFVKDIDEDPEVIKILSARAIAVFLGVDLWEEDFDLMLLAEPAPFALVEQFIVDKTFQELSVPDFLNGSVNGVIPDTIRRYAVQKKISLQTLEKVLSALILSADLTRHHCYALFESCVILSDSDNTALANKCRQIIKTVDDNGWGFYSNRRDVLKELEYHGFTLSWYAEWLSE